MCLHDLFTALLARRDVGRLLEIDRELRAVFARSGMEPDAAELNRRINALLVRDDSGSDGAAAELATAAATLRRAIDQVADGVPERSQLRAILAECLRQQYERRLAGVTAEVVTST